MPVRVLVGSSDLADFRAIAERLARTLPDAELQELAGAGHLLPLERPTRWRPRSPGRSGPAEAAAVDRRDGLVEAPRLVGLAVLVRPPGGERGIDEVGLLLGLRLLEGREALGRHLPGVLLLDAGEPLAPFGLRARVDVDAPRRDVLVDLGEELVDEPLLRDLLERPCRGRRSGPRSWRR
jgi:hypothetical protein